MGFRALEPAVSVLRIHPESGARARLEDPPLSIALNRLYSLMGLHPSPTGEYQLVQDELARMEVARTNLQNLVFRSIELAHGRAMTFAEASAMKPYAARAAVEVAMEAVQVCGGNGYLSEYIVEQLARDVTRCRRPWPRSRR